MNKKLASALLGLIVVMGGIYYVYTNGTSDLAEDVAPTGQDKTEDTQNEGSEYVDTDNQFMFSYDSNMTIHAAVSENRLLRQDEIQGREPGVKDIRDFSIKGGSIEFFMNFVDTGTPFATEDILATVNTQIPGVKGYVFPWTTMGDDKPLAAIVKLPNGKNLTLSIDSTEDVESLRKALESLKAI